GWCARTARTAPMDEPLAAEEPGPGRGLSFRTRLTAALVGTAIVPLAVFGFVVYLTGSFDPTVGRLLLFAMVVTILVAVLFSYLVPPRPHRTCAVTRSGGGPRVGGCPVDTDPGGGRGRARSARREPQPVGRGPGQ